MEGNISISIRSSSFKHSDQRGNSIEPNPIADPLQILENRLKGEHFKPHRRSGEASHADVSSHIDDEPVFPVDPHPLQNLLDRCRDVRSPKGLPFEQPDDVLVGLLREVTEIGEGVDERVFEILDGVGDYGFGLGAFEAVERRDWEVGGVVDGWVWSGVLEK